MPTKTPSIVSTILTVLTLLIIVAASMFISLVALNGFSEREGTPALVTSFVCNSIGIILSAVLAWKLPKWFIGKYNWNNVVAVLVSVLAGVVLGGGLSLISMFIGIVVADSMWNAR